MPSSRLVWFCSCNEHSHAFKVTNVICCILLVWLYICPCKKTKKKIGIAAVFGDLDYLAQLSDKRHSFCSQKDRHLVPFCLYFVLSSRCSQIEPGLCAERGRKAVKEAR